MTENNPKSKITVLPFPGGKMAIADSPDALFDAMNIPAPKPYRDRLQPFRDFMDDLDRAAQRRKVEDDTNG